MGRLLENYEPRAFFDWFEAITKIPRESHHEQQMIAFLVKFAEDHSLQYKVDKSGNVLMTVPATSGYENEPPILLQGHMDMVCIKDEGVDFDFSKDAIRLIINGNLLEADGTTLGADNGVGVAIMLAIADDHTICHPLLELLFTVEEEVGMLGIRNYDMTPITARRMVNLDSGYSHEMCVCGAGASICEIRSNFEHSSTVGLAGLQLTISDGLGGHTGLRIHMGRACAGNLVGEILYELQKQMPVYLTHMRTSENDASILNYCRVDFAVAEERQAEAINVISTYWEMVKTRFTDTDKGVICHIDPCAVSEKVLNDTDSRKIINLLFLFHTGAQKHDGNDPTVVVASSCINPSSLVNGKLIFNFRIRSSDDTVRKLLVDRYTEIAKLLDLNLCVVDAYPGWPLRANSRMQEIFKSAHLSLFGEEITVEYMHAGVEVGVIMGAIPDMDAVGISPTARNAHTTKENLYLDEVKPFWDLLLMVLQMKS